MIEDTELRDLFRAESEEHLQTLENGLLHLEAEPGDSNVLEGLFRSAHSLKGAARMLGLAGLESLAHHFEDELGKARHGRQTMTSESADRLYQGLDAMRMLAIDACGGTKTTVDLPGVLAQLRGETTQEPEETSSVKLEPEQRADRLTDSEISKPTKGIPLIQEPLVGQGNSESEALSTNPEVESLGEPKDSSIQLVPTDEDTPLLPLTNFKIETIRVEPSKLDALMNLASETSVTTARVHRSVAVVDDLVELWEEWSRDFQSATESARLKRMATMLHQLEAIGEADIGRLRLLANDLIESIRDIRLLPLSTIFNLYPRLVRDLSHEQGKEVRFEIEGGTITADKHLLEEIKDPLMHMIRNAVDHAVELPNERERLGKPREATILLRATRTTTHIAIEISDDGRGLDEDAIRRRAIQKQLVNESEMDLLSAEDVFRLIFLPGFTTASLITDVSGRGVGLDVVRMNVERLKGSISFETKLGAGSTFRILAPISLVTTRVLRVQVAERSYAFPIESVQETFVVSRQEVFLIEGRATIRREEGPIRAISLGDLLELPPTATPSFAGSSLSGNNSAKNGLSTDLLYGVLLISGSEKIGVFVDALLDEQEVVLKPFTGLIRRVRNVLASTTLNTGEICMILNPHDLVKSLSRKTSSGDFAQLNPEAVRKKLILVAEDSITTRTQEKRILEAAGYEVVVAVDGLDAFAKLESRAFDGVVSDVEMPNMTGLQLTERIRQEPKYKELPIVLVTSLATDRDRQRGMEVGANAYITKGTFDQNVLVETLGKLV
jgi:two-component system chemotaxis sensor kinase CheA